MELPKQVGYVIATENGEVLCSAEGGGLFLVAYPFIGDMTDSFLLCKYRNAADCYAKEWNDRIFFGAKPKRVKPVKVIVEIREFKKKEVK